MNETPIALQASRHAALGDPLRLELAWSLWLQDASPAVLGQRLGITSNLMAHHVGVLVKAGLVARVQSEADRRRVYLRLLPAGRAMIAGPRLHAGRVLFVCTQNSARSQFAHALWGQHSPIPSSCAGTKPASQVHALAKATAARRGLDLNSAQPRGLKPGELSGSLVVTVCDHADEALTPGHLGHLHWSIPDPASGGDPIDFDTAFDRIAERIWDLAQMTEEQQ
jgi:protein-tyrosine-phosphatase